MDRTSLEHKARSLMSRIGAQQESLGSEVWISLTSQERLEQEIARVGDALDSGESMPLAGLFFAAKDNIDVAGFATTAAHPDFSHMPERSSAVVAALEQAGAIALGKTNMDQFATGLTGSRSPYGAVHSDTFPDRVSGGSSSGSAVSVAKEFVDFSLGTDTAGSGRVPAAFNHIYGFKPTCGVTVVEGVVPACESFDCVSVFAKDFATGSLVYRTLLDPKFPARGRGDEAAMAPIHRTRRLAVPREEDLASLSPIFREEFEKCLAGAQGHGYQLVHVDMTPFFESGKLLYEGALVAERYAAVGEFMEHHHEHADPSVEHIVLNAKEPPAYRYVREKDLLARRIKETLPLFSECEGLLVPTTGRHPTMSEVAAQPIAVNSELGLFTTFVNLLDMAGIAFPVASTAEGECGATLLVPALHDAEAIRIVAELADEQLPESDIEQGSVPILVFGAHRRGQALNSQLTQLQARYLSTVSTAPHYVMGVMPGTGYPRVRLVEGEAGESITGELWNVPVNAFARFAQMVRQPLSIGPVELSDGRYVLGFLCGSVIPGEETNISELEDWLSYAEAAG